LLGRRGDRTAAEELALPRPQQAPNDDAEQQRAAPSRNTGNTPAALLRHSLTPSPSTKNSATLQDTTWLLHPSPTLMVSPRGPTRSSTPRCRFRQPSIPAFCRRELATTYPKPIVDIDHFRFDDFQLCVTDSQGYRRSSFPLRLAEVA
jgi:hypothetical protein